MTAVGASVLEGLSRCKTSGQRTNILFIATDDLRVELGCYGDTPAITPNIDKLASRSTLFNRAYCQETVCNPSRASLLTGKRPDTLRVWDLFTHFRSTHPDIVTLPQWFKKHGYFTQGIGKIFHNWHQEIEGDPNSWSVPEVMHWDNHSADKPLFKSGPLPPDQTITRFAECRDVPDSAYFDGRIAVKAVETLRRLKQQKQPFFLAVGFWKPHLPFNAPKCYWDLYDREKLQLPANPRPPEGVPEVALTNDRGRVIGPKGPILRMDEILELRHGYLAAISYLDAQVGKALDALDELSLAESTVVVFWSDHGLHLGEHGLWRKFTNFELDARVPLIIALPKPRHAGSKTDALVELLDLFPTLVELCGLPMPEGLEGKSLVSVLNDATASVKPAAFTQNPRPFDFLLGKVELQTMGVSVRTNRYRYTEWRDFRTGRIVARELYDHRTDPRETHNVITLPTDRTELKKAIALLEETFPHQGWRKLKPQKGSSD
jgi:iduronate 2-sulfatase